MKRWLKRFIPGIIWVYSMSTLVSCLYAQEAYKYTQTEQFKGHSKQDIYLRYQKLKPVLEWEQIYETSPLLTVPYDEGSLKEAFLQDGLNGVNWMRYLAGLPDDIQLDYSLAECQQIGSLINYVGEFSHYPSKPEGMSEAMYQQGRKATSTSNLASGYSSIYESIKGYMEDSDSSNISRVGHRRWVLNPQMQKTMFGYVGKEFWGNYYGASSMYALDESRTEEFAYNAISWPSAGYFPKEYFEDKTAWSVSLNPQVYARDRVEDITVKLRREKTGEEWLFTQDDQDTLGKFFNVETSGYGVPFCIIFRPDLQNYFMDNVEETYTVSVMGLYKKDGMSASLTFSTTFFDLNNYNPRLEAFVTRLYEDCLNREADEEGLAYWGEGLKKGQFTGASMAHFFVTDEEFKNRNLSDTEYIETMYRVFFDRDADQGGISYWQSCLDQGMTRNYVLAGFINSDEFLNLCTSFGIIRGEMILEDVIDLYPQVAQFVDRFYEKCMNRKPDEEGLRYWVNGLVEQIYTGTSMAESFTNTPEFENQDLSDEEYLEVLYRMFFNREGDESGKAYWLGVIANGSTRKYVTQSFVYSNEFQGICDTYGIRYC